MHISSAEWVTEAPSVAAPGGYRILPLADFGKVTFTGASATAGGHTGSVTDSHWKPRGRWLVLQRVMGLQQHYRGQPRDR